MRQSERQRWSQQAIMRPLLAMLLTVAAGLSSTSHAEEGRDRLHVVPLFEYVETVVKPWLRDTAVAAAITAQNTRTVLLSADDITRLDGKWRSELAAGGGPLIEATLKNPLSDLLRAKMSASRGLILEAFVMDARGLNVAMAEPTTDYFQGDEDKWSKTFPNGAEAVFVDDVKRDASTSLRQAQVSATVIEPDTGEPIGVITLGINIDAL